MARRHEALAEAELQESLRLLEEGRRKAARLAAENHRNQFSDMIRDALAVGYDGHRHERNNS